MNDFGGHVAMIFLLLFILFQYNFQIMRSICQEECEADVSILLRSRCQNEFQIMRSLCQEECEADITILRSQARYQDTSKSSQIPAAGKGFQSSEVGPPWFKTVPNRLPGAFEETEHIQTRGLVDLFWR